MRPTLALPTRGGKTSCAFSQQQQKHWLSYFQTVFAPQNTSKRQLGSRKTRYNQHHNLSLPWLISEKYVTCPKGTSPTHHQPCHRFSTNTSPALTAFPLPHPKDNCTEDHFNNEIDSNLPKTIEKHHPRHINSSKDIDEFLSYLNVHAPTLGPEKVFRSLRTALYNAIDYNYDKAWCIYETILEKGVGHLMRINNYNHLLNILKFSSDEHAPARMFLVLNHMQNSPHNHPIVIGPYSYGQILFALERRGDVVSISKVMDTMEQRGIVIPQNFYTLLAFAARRKQTDENIRVAANIMTHAMKKNVMLEQDACAIIISLMSRLPTITETVDFLQGMDLITADTNNTPTSVTANNCDADVPRPLYSIHIYTSLIAGLARKSDATNAMRLFREMRKQGLKPTIVTYSALIEAHAKAGDFDTATRILRKRVSRKGSASKYSVAFTSIITNAIRHGKLDLAEELATSFLEQSNVKSEHMEARFRTALLWCRTKRCVKDGQAFFDSLWKEHPGFCNEFMINHLINAYGNDENKTKVYDTYSLLQQLNTEEASMFSYHHLTNALFKCSDVPGAMVSFGMLRKQGIPDDISLAMVIRGLVTNNEGEVAWRLFKIQRERGIEPNLHAYTSIIKAFANKKAHITRPGSLLTPDILEAADIPTKVSTEFNNANIPGSVQSYNIFKQLTGFQKPNVYIYTTLIACFSKTNIKQAVEIYRHMRSNNVEPTVETYTALLQGCAIFRDATMSLIIFKDMREQKIVPNKHTWRYLLKSMIRSHIDKSKSFNRQKIGCLY
ncbi:hypothetical protein PHYBLDRAFT_70427 [Phycomyces blakesleeanus NRRL 1555(-)]|uniref:Pentacotripeptide-repeat region of PRORP domain-containing protein n=1 Tax=Phycomyces blakesleeanus (strain ATCC 8743b / DSM 1359 / FGSC 10004 / NBRC 33097 / NRRL 1555) TaxID=763407 RepID=A0A162NI85_PHYB8|nr:hypothetical protein PHYBLDRAFT_70427 [Phycomyces blakesleeanus NRRL 1555(-)]OAD69914.1 hypothetical protein PHYBLDRAFT_70427 [Phycomyces blakesleeanus NRRL 1555(-)]|eukprot:XP_018287954.1 hypothetical protein PHYBLDRAFT_70427 [Phycomyces blakesleeanus NRRL 1555(-)]